ncbi:hypothetical protein CCD93_13795 [Vibrio sp. T21]|nr:hypothetical protein CCD93_13795 [Vibrio sp. T21]
MFNMKKLASFCVQFIDNLNNPLKSSLSYILLNSVFCISFALAILLFNIAINLDIWNVAWDSLLSNISVYKDVFIFSIFSLVYIFFFLKRNAYTLFAAFSIKFVSTAYMVNMIFTTFSMFLINNKCLEDRWSDILPYRHEYPFFAMGILVLVWWSTWYASLTQRNVLKRQNSDYKDLFDNIRAWFDKRS